MTKSQRAKITSKFKEMQRLRGRRLLDVLLNAAVDGDNVTFHPVLVFEDGTKLRFAIQESEEWADGVCPYLESVN